MNKSEMKKYLTGNGFRIYDKTSSGGSTTVIEWEGIEAGYLLAYHVEIFVEYDNGNKKLMAVRYNDPRCLERVDRLILYLKTSELRRERRMRRERADQVRDYFNKRKNAVNEIEQFMLAEMC